MGETTQRQLLKGSSEEAIGNGARKKTMWKNVTCYGDLLTAGLKDTSGLINEMLVTRMSSSTTISSSSRGLSPKQASLDLLSSTISLTTKPVLTFLINSLGSGGYSIFDSTATTYLLSSGVEDSEQSEFIQRYKDI